MSRATTSPSPFDAGRFVGPAGGGAFRFDRLSIGVFLVEQPSHQISLGGDKLIDHPLAAHEGWLLPAGVDGICAFEDEHAFVVVELGESILRDVGLDPRQTVAPRFGAHDPLLVQMALTAAAPPAGAPQLYLDTMRQALAAHAVQTLLPQQPSMPAVDDARLRRALDLIHDDTARDLSLDALAAEAAMSPFHFARAFKQATGHSPLQYVIAERLARARVLIKTTKLPVAEIAHRVGYADVSRFGQHYKRRFGEPPSAARR